MKRVHTSRKFICKENIIAFLVWAVLVALIVYNQ